MASSSLTDVRVPIDFAFLDLIDRTVVLAVLGTWFGFGSFAVPMKWKAVKQADVHPLVYQSYRTFWNFVFSNLVLLFVDFEFSWWGLLSGLCWVPAGVAAALVLGGSPLGLSKGQGIMQMSKCLVSLIWGFVILRDEQVYNWWGTAVSVLAMICGAIGMTQITDRPVYQSLADACHEPDDEIGLRLDSKAASTPPVASGSLVFGSLAAVFNGIWGGSNLVPSKLAPLHGVHFVSSFAIGSALVNAVLVVMYISMLRCRGEPLPSLHLRVMAIPGVLSGILWAFANICSLYIVQELGQAIGTVAIEANVIVAGLWGMFLYAEITMRRSRMCWFACCFVCLLGILGISLERIPK